MGCSGAGRPLPPAHCAALTHCACDSGCPVLALPRCAAAGRGRRPRDTGRTGGFSLAEGPWRGLSHVAAVGPRYTSWSPGVRWSGSGHRATASRSRGACRSYLQDGIDWSRFSMPSCHSGGTSKVSRHQCCATWAVDTSHPGLMGLLAPCFPAPVHGAHPLHLDLDSCLGGLRLPACFCHCVCAGVFRLAGGEGQGPQKKGR